MLVRTIPRGDLAIEDGHFVLARGVRYVRQKLSVRFKFFLGEWFLDLREGVPYYRDVFTWNPNLPVIRSLFRRIALTTPGVLSVPRFEIRFTPSDRMLRFDFQAVCSGGDIIVRPEDRDFILDVQA
jgi:hypothetical protein